MVCPGGGGAAAHLQDVHHDGIDSGVRIAPDVEEDTECSDVEHCFYWKLTKEEVQRRNWRGLAELQESSEDFLLEDFQRLHYCWPDWESRKTRQQNL